MLKKWFMFLLVGLLLWGCSNEGNENESHSPADPQPVEDKETASRQLELQVIAQDLKVPWAVNKTDDTFYISEREGSIVKVEEGQQTRQEVVLEKPLAGASEAGLLGFVLAPDFQETGKAFGYYTYQDIGQFNRIIELTLKDNQWRETKLLLDKIPSGNVHHGGRLAFGPDGKLYATAGDAAEPELAQNLDKLNGKILRLNQDGTVPNDNPFKDSYVFSYGHRNPQGMTWAEDGTMYASEHGPNAHDEINIIEPGKNYGWPVIVGDDKQEGMESPLFHSGTDTWAPSGMVISNGKIYVATLRGNAVREFNLETMETREVVTGLGRIRDVFLEGNQLYFVSNNTDGRGVPQENDDKLYQVSLPTLAE
ncbi:MAG: PQQ-dependent sugar dehydrogenase [Bacillota bacterium]